MYMKKLLIENKSLIILFIIWKVLVFLVLILTINFFKIDPHTNFLGGGFENYIRNPYLFSWANFDGEHYLAIAIQGYKSLEYAFFPVYPLLINLSSQFLSYDHNSSWDYAAISGIVISNFFFLLCIILFKKLIELDYDKKIANLAVMALIFFPTSFYFGAVYNESLFLFFILSSFYLIRKNNWAFGSFMGLIASGTRVMGIFLLPALLYEAYLQKSLSKLIWILLVPIGLIFYMFYQYASTGDPLAFYHLQTTIGEHRQTDPILLPQVFYRYAKILLTVPLDNPIYQTVVLELISTVIFLALLVYGYFMKIRRSYLLYGILALLVSPLQGSLTSMPRYILVIFPAFIALALFLNKLPSTLRWILMGVSVTFLVIESSLYFRGVWVG